MNPPPNTATQPNWKQLVERFVSSIESAHRCGRFPSYVWEVHSDARAALAAMQVPGPIPFNVRQPTLSDCAPWERADPDELLEEGDLWCWCAILDPWSTDGANHWTWHRACIAWARQNGASHWLPHWAMQVPNAAEVPPLHPPATSKESDPR